jgi:hypothetical protein
MSTLSAALVNREVNAIEDGWGETSVRVNATARITKIAAPPAPPPRSKRLVGRRKTLLSSKLSDGPATGTVAADSRGAAARAFSATVEGGGRGSTGLELLMLFPPSA